MPVQQQQTKYVLILAVISGLILLIGTRLKPEQAPEAPVSQTEMLRLKMMTQRQNLQEMTDFFSRVAEQVRDALVWIHGLESCGLVWDETGLVVTALPSGAFTDRVSTDDFPLEIESMSRNHPVVSMRAPAEAGLRTVFRSLAANIDPGAWVVQVAIREDGELVYAPGTLGGVAKASCGDFEVEILRTNVPLADSALGGGVFDMDGNLLAAVLRCGNQYQAVTPAGVEQILTAARSFEGQLLRRYGFRVEPLNEVSQKHFGTDRGVLVTEVLDARPAETSGLVPGDIIQALDSGEVQQPEDLARLVLPVAYAAFDFWIWRGGKTQRLLMPAVEYEFPREPEVIGDGIFLTTPLRGYVIGAVVPGSPADRAALKRGDRLLTVNGRNLKDFESARKILSVPHEKPQFLVVRRGERKLGVFVN